MNEERKNIASGNHCQEHGTRYQPGFKHWNLEDRDQWNDDRRSTADSTCNFLADVLCRCGALAKLWSDLEGLFVWCRECGDFRMIDSNGIEELGDALVGWGFAAKIKDQSN
jgi:hypothetical protein